jgi:multidrug efflux pump subunit AcrA (membrane-fusion protein)
MNEDNLRKGKIIKVYPELESGRVTADAEVENLGDFFVGERVQALIPVAKRKTFVAPAAAVSTRVGVDYVRILRNGAPYDVAVIVAPLMNGDSKNVEVLSGLLEGDKVVTP